MLLQTAVKLAKAWVKERRESKQDSSEPQYSCVEVFSGVQEIARGDGFGFEFRKDERMNLRTEQGRSLG